MYGDPELHPLIRQKCCDYLEAERTFFGEFVEGDFQQYLSHMRCPGHWGDHTEIQVYIKRKKKKKKKREKREEKR